MWVEKPRASPQGILERIYSARAAPLFFCIDSWPYVYSTILLL